MIVPAPRNYRFSEEGVMQVAGTCAAASATLILTHHMGTQYIYISCTVVVTV